MRTLSRYVLWQWLRVFLLTAVGLPFVSVLTQLTDNLRKLLERNLSASTIALSYLYALPQNVAQMMPAAALFAAVFTVGPLARNSELTAAKAGGISFHRIVRPLFLVSALAAVVCFLIGEWATEATTRQLELQKERQARNVTTRYNFVYRAPGGWVYTIRVLNTTDNQLQQVVLEHAVRDPQAPLFAITADSARWDPAHRRWRFMSGASHLLSPGGEALTLSFGELSLASFREAPRDLLIEPKNHSEMTYGELGRYIASLKASGNDTKKLRVEQAVKLALPAACLIIALFGAPLAVSAPRAGPAVGIAISLGTTLAYLLMINFSQAVGASGVMNPVAAAWLPNAVFLGLGVWLLVRVRT
ncbi:MAG TPA: LptF/LptG family permease [Gemmatimonadales bacterium]|nr:LptF/LptG family permease [Gemmatimonadales bacterium]